MTGVSHTLAPAPVIAPAAINDPESEVTGKIIDLAVFDSSVYVQVNVVTSVVVPSTIDTPPNRKAMPDTNFGNWVKPEAIADVIHWHCTKEAAVLRESILKVYNYA